jgi:hypothetical protein
VGGVAGGGNNWLECGMVWAWSIGLERFNPWLVRKIRIWHMIEKLFFERSPSIATAIFCV